MAVNMPSGGQLTSKTDLEIHVLSDLRQQKWDTEMIQGEKNSIPLTMKFIT